MIMEEKQMTTIKEMILEQAKGYTIKEAIPYQIEENLLKEYKCYQAYLAGANYALSKLVEFAGTHSQLDSGTLGHLRAISIDNLKKLAGME